MQHYSRPRWYRKRRKKNKTILYKGEYLYKWWITDYITAKGLLSTNQKLLVEEYIEQKRDTILRKKNEKKSSKERLEKRILDYHGINLKQYHKVIKNPCELCGSNKNKHLHHKILKSEGGENTPENRQVLCRKCHEKVHGFKIPRLTIKSKIV